MKKASGKRSSGQPVGRSATPGQLLPKSTKSDEKAKARGDATALKPSRKRWKSDGRDKYRRRTQPKVKRKFQRKVHNAFKERRRTRKKFAKKKEKE